MTPATYKMTGNTYQNRAEIKALGAKWSPAEKAWYVKGSLHSDTVWKLRRQGVLVTTQSTPSHYTAAYPTRSKELAVRMHPHDINPDGPEGWVCRDGEPIDEPESFPMQPHEPAPNVCGYCGIQTCPDGCCCGC